MGTPSHPEAEISEGDVICRVDRACARITLNRPQFLNALTTDMRAQISASLATWQNDPMIYAVVIDANGGRAFCAGGDVRELHAWGRNDPMKARASLAAEYALNWQIECFTKPIVSFIDGPCMGSGVGLTAFGTHRVAGKKYGFAMPETGIGFFPDVGATWLLSRLPGRAGRYLALSGRSIDRSDAYALGLASHCIDAENFAEITEALAEAEPVDPLLDAKHLDPGPGQLARYRGLIETAFDAPDIEQTLKQLGSGENEDAIWAAELANELREKSPVSLVVTQRQFTRAPPATLRDGLIREYRQADRFLNGADFYEGVRAALIDKDRSPKWNPADIAVAGTIDVEDYFAPPAGGDLELPERPDVTLSIA